MKRFLSALAFLVAFVSGVRSNAQVVITGDMFGRTSFNVKAQVLDSLTREPIAFASAYLRHPKDTVITSFALTDTLGKAELKDVAKGEHLLCIEYLGYKPVYRKIYVRANYDAKVILMQPDERMLKAATVSAAATPMEIRQDTVIYNAAAFNVMSNDNLADLLKKMPGIEVGQDGKVKVNGKEVSKITVNGRTFFLGDNKATLDNLPAKIVDKVKVIDQESESAQFTGISGDKEKVMDVELKEEYKSGWFGNATLAGGTTLSGKDDKGFKVNKDFIYNGSAMVSVYGEKNQLTSIANGRNFVPPGSGVMYMYGSESEIPSLPYEGLHKSFQVGANLNSDAVKGFTTDASVVFSSERVDKHSRTDRTTFKEVGGDIFDTSEGFENGGLDKLSVRAEITKKDKKKTSLSFEPYLYWYNHDNTVTDNTMSLVGDEEKNRSESYSYSTRKGVVTGGDLSAGIKKLGKDRRAVTLDVVYTLGVNDGDAVENSTAKFAASTDSRDLLYDRNGSYSNINVTVNYVEPFGKYWAVAADVNTGYSVRKSTSDATNAIDGSVNDYYSSVSDNYYFTNEGKVLAQFKKDKTNLQFGGQAIVYQNENYARSFGLDTKTGVGEWQSTFSPFVNLRYSDKNHNGFISVFRETNRPSPASIVPTFNIVNPTRVTAGNIYLKPSVRESLNSYYRGTWGKVRFNGWMYGDYSTNSRVSAIWFDENSVRYSIPVNTKKPGYNLNLDFNAAFPVTKDGKLRMIASGNYFVQRTVSYQTVGTLAGIDLDSFDYAEFMSGFWGDASGDRFYSGESGFKESLTNSSRWGIDLGFTLSLDGFRLDFGPSVSNSRSNYSVDSKANTNTWETKLSLNPSYTSPHGFEFESRFAYRIRRGFGAGYNDDYVTWYLTVGKDIKAFNISLIAQDILDSARAWRRSVVDDYVQDSYTNVLGRRIVLSFTWNFGKMDASKSGAAQNAMWNMAY